MKKEYLESLITFARKIKTTGVNHIDFKVFDTIKMDTYAQQAKEQWGHTAEHKEYNEKTRNQSSDFQKNAWQNLMHIFVEFGEMKAKEPEHAEVQAQVKKMKRPCKKLAWPLFILLSIFYINERC